MINCEVCNDVGGWRVIDVGKGSEGVEVDEFPSEMGVTDGD